MSDTERQLVRRWAPELVALSYCISWLGAYTSTQIIIHAKYSQRALVKWLWTFLASVAFGFCGIWSMHFVGMLACGLDVNIGFDPALTVLSAAVAVVFTFAAFSSAYATQAIERSRLVRALSRMSKRYRRTLLPLARAGADDIEAAYTALPTTDEEGSILLAEERTEGAAGVATAERREGDDVYEGADDDERESVLERRSLDGQEREQEQERRTARAGHTPPPPPPPSLPLSPSASRGQPTRRRASFSGASPRHGRGRARTTGLKSPPMVRQRSLPPAQAVPPRLSHSQEPGAHESPSTSTSSSSSSLYSRNLSGTTLTTGSAASTSWGENLYVGLSRETRMRIKAQARERPVPLFGWGYWWKTHYETLSVLVVLRAAVWGLALVLMHYCGMWAMEIPSGRIAWNPLIVVLSYVVAFTLCVIACIAMVHMEVHFGRQVAFSTIAATGVCSMHYTGMAAATFYTYSAPSPNAGYPPYLPLTIITVAVLVCVVSNVVLAHSAITARNRMAEMILTKRRLWRIMAEKDAAEQANELKQQFISVASHEIRTPLHTVNGYCDLLARTDLTEEQALYVTSIQQACHAINVIAGNVLDYSKLDRNNVELSARPVLMEPRKMVEDLARITEAKGVQPGQPGADVIISVAHDVPTAVYLDETYTFRVLMNLLSNAQKFCDEGYICVTVWMGTSEQLVASVADTGCGIPKNFRNALFEPFRQADTSMTRPRQGTGLGLSIVKHLVQRMSGTVEVDSVEGEGTTFTVKLPVTLPSYSPSHSKPPSPKPTGKRMRVVYRHKRTEELMMRLWAQFGYSMSSGSPLAPPAQLTEGVDAIWTDSESVIKSPSLRQLLTPAAPRVLPVYIVYLEREDLRALEPELSEARNVVLVKRPVILHHVVPWLEHPEEHMGAHLKPATSKVRFIVPPERAPSPMQLSPTPALPPSLLKEKYREREYGAGEAGPSRVRIEGLDVLLEPPKRRQRVLLVEDNLVNQRLGCRLLEKLGYEVTTADDGQQAVELLHSTTFQACLMDCQMPVLDGFSATRKIRELEKDGILSGHLPVVALTANVTSESEDECRSAGMDHFLPKPIKLVDLESILAKCARPLEEP